MRRTIIHGEALAWMAANHAPPFASVITSLPDVSEMPSRDFEAWRSWFVEAARQVLAWIPDGGVAIFFQSDIRHEGQWVDKGYLAMRAAEDQGVPLIWHKIICRKPPGTITFGRSSYSHLLCFAKRPMPSVKHPGPDVVADGGRMTWRRGMGEGAVRAACRFLREETATTVVVDPFCGQGSVLAIANEFGFAALGVEINARRSREAQELVISST